MRLFPKFFRIVQKHLLILHTLKIGVKICHGHDILNIGIRGDRIAVTVRCRHSDRLKGIDDPGIRIILVVAHIVRIITPHDT